MKEAVIYVSRAECSGEESIITPMVVGLIFKYICVIRIYSKRSTCANKQYIITIIIWISHLEDEEAGECWPGG